VRHLGVLAGTDMFGSPAKSWMINFRVDDVDAMVERLRDPRAWRGRLQPLDLK
jgi:hypothetical protein